MQISTILALISTVALSTATPVASADERSSEGKHYTVAVYKNNGCSDAKPIATVEIAHANTSPHGPVTCNPCHSIPGKDGKVIGFKSYQLVNLPAKTERFEGQYMSAFSDFLCNSGDLRNSTNIATNRGSCVEASDPEDASDLAHSLRVEVAIP